MIASSKHTRQSSLITIECFLITHTEYKVALFALIKWSNFEMKGYVIGKGLAWLFSTRQCQPGIKLSFFHTLSHAVVECILCDILNFWEEFCDFQGERD